MKKIIALLIAAFAITACSNMSNTEQRTLSGAGIGAAAGAVGTAVLHAIRFGVPLEALPLVQHQAMFMMLIRNSRLQNITLATKPARPAQHLPLQTKLDCSTNPAWFN